MLGVIGGTSAFVGVIAAWRGDRWGWAVARRSGDRARPDAVAVASCRCLPTVQFPWRTLAARRVRRGGHRRPQSTLAPERLALVVAPGRDHDLAAARPAYTSQRPLARSAPSRCDRISAARNRRDKAASARAWALSAGRTHTAACPVLGTARDRSPVASPFRSGRSAAADRAVEPSGAEPGTGLIRLSRLGLPHRAADTAVGRESVSRSRSAAAAATAWPFAPSVLRAGSPLACAPRIPHDPRRHDRRESVRKPNLSLPVGRCCAVPPSSSRSARRPVASSCRRPAGRRRAARSPPPWRVPEPSRRRTRMRDAYRHPTADARLLWASRPSQTVVELYPSGGWYLHILAPLVAAKGHYIAAVSPGAESPRRRRTSLLAADQRATPASSAWDAKAER